MDVKPQFKIREDTYLILFNVWMATLIIVIPVDWWVKLILSSFSMVYQFTCLFIDSFPNNHDS